MVNVILSSGVITLGLSGLIAQVLLTRELLVVFSGNELSLGIIFSTWLIIESFGCLIAVRKITKTKNIISVFFAVTLVFTISLYTSVFISKILKILLNVSVGETVGFTKILISSLMTLFPVSITHGALFIILCKIFKLYVHSHLFSGKVYVLETIGSMIGGILSTFLMFPFMNSYQIISFLSLINYLICISFLIIFPGYKKAKLTLWFLNISLLTLNIYISVYGAYKLNDFSIKKQFYNQNVIHYENSNYNNFCVVENQGQYIFFLDGAPEVIIPIPDIGFLEEFVHIPLLNHQNPSEVLLLCGGIGGIIYEILKYNSIKKIDYVELDPTFIKLYRKFKTPLTEIELNDDKVNIIYTDGRFFLQNTKKKYDLIFLNINEPSTLQTNRFFTKEFFNILKKRLKDDGFFVFGLIGSINYRSDDLKNLNSCIFETLKSVFQFIKVIPGKINIFIASNSKEKVVDNGKILEILKMRGIKTSADIPWYIEQKFHPGWKNWFSDFIKDGSKKINTDLSPIAFYYNLSYKISLFEPKLKYAFNQLQNLSFINIIIFLFLTILAFHLFLYFFKPKVYSIGIPICVFTTGISGMSFDLLLIFVFQSIYGYIYTWMGFLVSFFMTGIATGAYFINLIIEKYKNYFKIFVFIEILIMLFSVTLTFIFVENKVLFPIISLIGGLLIGSQFPVANALYISQKRNKVLVAGILYSMDLVGGCVGGLLIGVIFLPFWGFRLTCFILATIKIIGLIILFMEKKL